MRTLLCLLALAAGASAKPPQYAVADGGLTLEGVSAKNPIVYDNDWWTDMPDAAYLWAKASLGACDLRGNVVTRCTFGWETKYAHSLDEQLKDCAKLVKAARASGLRNVPEPVVGAREALRRPASGKHADTAFARTPGSDLIVAEARKATPGKPLLVFVGGSCTTIASAYLSDPAIADRVVVFQIDGRGYNGSDAWAWDIAQAHFRFANWARGYFWPDVSEWDAAAFDALPKNPLGELLRGYARTDLARANQWGDGAWIYWLFDRRCLTRAEDYDRTAITVPKAGTDAKRMAAEFFATMRDPKAYGE